MFHIVTSYAGLCDMQRNSFYVMYVQLFVIILIRKVEITDL